MKFRKLVAGVGLINMKFSKFNIKFVHMFVGTRMTCEFIKLRRLFHVMCFLIIESCFVNPDRNWRKHLMSVLSYFPSKPSDQRNCLTHFKSNISSVLALNWINMLCVSLLKIFLLWRERFWSSNRQLNCYLLVVPHRRLRRPDNRKNHRWRTIGVKWVR